MGSYYKLFPFFDRINLASFQISYAVFLSRLKILLNGNFYHSFNI